MMKKFFLLSAFLFCFACSKIETGLSFAPRIATNRIDDAFDFDSAKLTQIRQQIDSDIKKSKSGLASRVIAHIEKIEGSTQKDEVTKEHLLSLFNDFAETQTAFLESFKNSANVTLKNLTPEETENFKKFSAKKYAENLNLAKDKKSFLKKTYKLFEKNYELFFDGLTDGQETMLSKFLDAHFDYFTERIVSRQKFSEQFYLKIKSQDPVLDFFLTHYSGKKFNEITDASLKNYLDEFFQFQVAFWKSTTPKQKTFFQKKLKDYKDELLKIAATKS